MLCIPLHEKILVENPVCHKSQRKWPECRNATGVSQVTPPAESIEMVQYSPVLVCDIGGHLILSVL